MEPNFDVILEEGCIITSSGTTGTPKKIYRDPVWKYDRKICYENMMSKYDIKNI